MKNSIIFKNGNYYFSDKFLKTKKDEKRHALLAFF